MHTARALAILHDHQAGVLAQLDVAMGAGSDGAEPPGELRRAELAKARWELIRRLRAYQLFKHGEIFAPAIARGDPARRAAATQLKAGCEAAAEAFGAYVARWSGADIVAGWDQYRIATRAAADRLRRHVAAERRQIEALLAGAERTRRLAG